MCGSTVLYVAGKTYLVDTSPSPFLRPDRPVAALSAHSAPWETTVSISMPFLAGRDSHHASTILACMPRRSRLVLLYISA